MAAIFGYLPGQTMNATALNTQFDAVIDFVHREIDLLCPWPHLAEAFQYYESLRVSDEALGFLTFPTMVHHAVGGEMATAVPLNASWLFFQIASQLFDDIQDGDVGSSSWHLDWPMPVRLNVGLGAIFAAKICLSKLETSRDTLTEIMYLLAQAGLLASHAQATEVAKPDLDGYFKNVIQKAGLLFAAMAQAAARLHTFDETTLKALQAYGLAVGTLVQIRDDVRDMSPAQISNDLRAGRHTLPVLYGLAQVSHPRYAALTTLLQATELSQQNIDSIYTILKEMKAIDFCGAVAQVYQSKACAALTSLVSANSTYLINYAISLLATERKVA